MHFQHSSGSQFAPQNSGILGALPGFECLRPMLQAPLILQAWTQLSVEQAQQEMLERGLASLIGSKNHVQPSLKVQGEVGQLSEAEDLAANEIHRSLTSCPSSA